MSENEQPGLPPCPECASEYAYESGALLVCPMCGHEWAAAEAAEGGTDAGEGSRSVRDAVGNVLSDGDSVTLVKSVKVSGGGGGTIKAGTKVSGIRLISDGVGDHDIDARVPGFGKLQLKSSVVKRAN
ncbi:phosphonoacetate hydrolase [Leucobacter sp. UCD-THU]|uniref:Alkylphosphonate utilization protein n=1 Tax=Leucobacter muris TaxID=1935379 RepID=A0ABX5QDI6_9MICO|nr:MULTISPECIES: zinc ribbon domain-containing protein YjdM [Leucobacter]EYT56555.1 phosphonoacetate hydrolase [Leucobacter sp. UCD-THU]QAB17083.1 alkylphosphonate utilization protein [Leucobacter muris]